MAESSGTGGNSAFATTILTSKTPQQAALILPNSLDSTTKLIDEKLINWFNHYTASIRAHNQNLQKLYDEGSKFFTEDQYFGEYGNFPRIWNCLLSSLQVEHQNNEILYKNLKLDALGPLKDVFDKDVRLSELMINTQELKEISAKLANNDNQAEIEWNYKAPQSFSNLENFKAFEIQLLFDVVLNFFQFHSSRLNKDSENNVNSTNYLLNNFKLDNELNHYAEYLVKTDFKPSQTNGFVNQQQQLQKKQHQSYNSPPKPSKRFSTFHKSDNQSIVSGSSSGKKSSTSKIKSRVGSIFGRKSKAEKSSGFGDTIPETESVNTVSSNQQLNAIGGNNQAGRSSTRGSLSRGNSVRRQSTDLHGAQHQRSQPELPQKDKPAPLPKQASSNERNSPRYYTNPAPAQPTTPVFGSSGHADTPPISGSTVPLVAEKNKKQAPVQQPFESPNVVPYHGTDSSSDEEGPEDVGVNGRRLSMLQRHDLAEVSPAGHPQPQQNEVVTPTKNPAQAPSSDGQLSVERARQRSSGMYSFEAGDDQNPIETSPKAKQNGFEPNQDLPDPNVSYTSPSKTFDAVKPRQPSYNSDSNSPFGSAGNYEQPPASSSTGPSTAGSAGVAPPPPPPSRKVVHHEDTLSSLTSGPQPTRDRKDVQSQIFHNLPSARESYIQPAGNPRDSIIQPPNGITSTGSLISQDTGNSLLKQSEFFKHFDSKKAESNGLNSSVAEVINVSFRDGKARTAQIIGEIAFNFKPTEDDHNLDPVLIKIANHFDKIILNNTFVEKVGDELFKISPAQILSKTLGGIKYIQKLNDSTIPVLIHHVWKYEPHQSSLMINLKLNPAIKNTPIVLNNLVVSVALNLNVQTSSVSSKPLGSFNKEKNRITWRYSSPLVLGEGVSEEKLIARFLTEGTASEHESGVQLKFQIQDPYLRNATIYDAEGFNEIPVARNLISGNYSAHA